MARKSVRRLGGLVAAAAALASVLAGTTPAHATKQHYDASGHTTIQLGRQVAKALTSNGCGAPIFYTVNGAASGIVTGAGALQLNFPITRAVFSDNGNFRLTHTGGVGFYNACYDVKFSNLYVQNLGNSGDLTTVDVLAKTREDGVDAGRTMAFTLDFSNDYSVFQIKNNGNTVIEKFRALGLSLGADGADEFNQLATGSSAGPFSEGQRIGNSRIVLKQHS